jgi:hypothetical protein
MTDDSIAPRPRRSLWSAIARGCLAGGVLALIGHVVYVMVGSNFHTVVPGAVYRSAQLSAASLEQYIRAKHIRTVINLRGCCEPESWYLNEGRVTLRNDVSLEDLGFSAGRLPSSETLRQLLELIDRSDYPILFHCHKGADRTGMASVLALLLLTDMPLEEARKQLGFRSGHLPIGRTVFIDRFFDLYQDWLRDHRLTHSPTVLRRWIERDYCPGDCRCALELVDPKAMPVHLSGPLPRPLRIRCLNTSIAPWHLHPGDNVGVHLIFVLSNDRGQCVASGKAGLFHAVVPPGESIDLTAVLPGGLAPGRYELRLDMEEEQHAFFMQTGSQPLFCPVEVP